VNDPGRPFTLPTAGVVAIEDHTTPVLIVDDDAAKRLALRGLLSPLGLRIVEAGSGVEALRAVMAEDFAVILLDVRMPHTSGFETAALIRQRKQSEMTPIIFVTAYASDDIEDPYIQGAVDFMFAPISGHELRAKVSVFANLCGRAKVLAAQARDVQHGADQLRLLTDAAPVGIFRTDAHNHYVYTNPRWSDITGMSSADALGAPWHTILRADEWHAITAAVGGGEGRDRDFSRRVTMPLRGAAPRIALLTVRSVPDGDGGIGGWVGTLADVTAEAGAEGAISAARDTALAATVQQEQFAATAAHELRTPTTSILGYIEEVLGNDALSDADRRFLEIAHRNGLRLSRLIDDLLTVDQAGVDATSLHLEPTALTPLLERISSSFLAAAEQEGIVLITDGATDTSSAVVDPLRLEQALTNLVGNAVKFTPAGGEVHLGIDHDDTDVRITVTDTGIGIPPGDVDRIFDRFYRARNADPAVKGSGLGLAIAKRMIEAQGGELDVHSAFGEGSRFTVTFPVAA
jgi:PAS domain S-box-containing protein